MEQLTTLEEQLEAYAKQAKQATIYEADESIADDHAKDEQIEQLQTENEALKAEVKKLVSCKAKIVSKNLLTVSTL